MAKLLLNLRTCHDDEAADVRAMLDTHRIALYETTPDLGHLRRWHLDQRRREAAKASG